MYPHHRPFKTTEEYHAQIPTLFKRKAHFPPDAKSVFDHMAWSELNIVLHACEFRQNCSCCWLGICNFYSRPSRYACWWFSTRTVAMTSVGRNLQGTPFTAIDMASSCSHIILKIFELVFLEVPWRLSARYRLDFSWRVVRELIFHVFWHHNSPQVDLMIRNGGSSHDSRQEHNTRGI